MTRSKFASCAIASAVLLAAAPLVRAARPHYGGTLVMQTTGVMRSLDPVSSADEAARARILSLIFEGLVRVDGAGLQPRLASSWEHDARASRWRFTIRSSVVLHDGSVLDATRVASLLSVRERQWKVNGDGNTVIIDLDRPDVDLPWILADAPHAIALGTGEGSLVGSGPFVVEGIDATRILLRAHDNYWGGRPFVDAVRIEQGRPPREQLQALESGRIDMALIGPTDVRRVVDRGRRITASRALTLYALVFEPHRSQSNDDDARAALAASIDRSTLATVLLQRQALPADGLLPEWISGYGMLLHDRPLPPPQRRVERPLILRIDAGDAIARALAERIAVDAHERGLDVTPQVAGSGLTPRPDVRLVRVRIEPTTPDRALASVMQQIGARAIHLVTTEQPPSGGTPLEDVFRFERTLLRYNIIVPVVHVADVYGLGDRLESWNEPPVSPTGAWNLAAVWLRSDRSGSR